jgi:capsular exopolysaccharide synthesis family protein
VGKSHVAAHLARAFATSGVTVVAVDGDLRRPRLSEEFQVEGQRGLADATRTPAGDDGWAVGHVASMGGMLYAVSAGQQVEDPVATLGSPRTEQALARLRGDHDVIVIDTPPVLGVADTLLLARAADGVALVVDIKQSRRRSVRRAVAVLREINAPLLGVVINSVDADAPYGYPARRAWRLGPRGAFAAMSVVLCIAAVAVVLLGIVDIAGR